MTPEKLTAVLAHWSPGRFRRPACSHEKDLWLQQADPIRTRVAIEVSWAIAAPVLGVWGFCTTNGEVCFEGMRSRAPRLDFIVVSARPMKKVLAYAFRSDKDWTVGGTDDLCRVLSAKAGLAPPNLDAELDKRFAALCS